MRFSLALSGLVQAAIVAIGVAPRLALAAAPAAPSAAVAARSPTVAASTSAASMPATPASRVANPAMASDKPLVEEALDALAPRVSRTSHPKALRMAFEAYYAYKAAHPKDVRNPYFYFVDYGLSKRTPRGYVFDMARKVVVDGPFIVAAGRGSGENSKGVPRRFSNASGSGASSLGLYVTRNTYSFTGHASGRTYHSIGLRLKGVSGRFNNHALARGVVVHGAPYVTASGAGRSLGCPAMAQARARRLIPKLANGGLVFLFSPNDSRWMRGAPWANG